MKVKRCRRLKTIVLATASRLIMRSLIAPAPGKDSDLTSPSYSQPSTPGTQSTRSGVPMTAHNWSAVQSNLCSILMAMRKLHGEDILLSEKPFILLSIRSSLTNRLTLFNFASNLVCPVRIGCQLPEVFNVTITLWMLYSCFYPLVK